MWLDQFEFAGFYIATEKGFYEKEGLDVEFVPYDPSYDTYDALFSGRADFSTGSASILMKHTKSKNKITILSSIFQSSPLMLLGVEGHGIETLNDIRGKRVMLTSEQQSFATFQTLLKSHNISLSELDIVPHSYNVDDLVNKKADLMVAYTTNEPFVLKERGYKPLILHPKDYGFDFYEELLFTSQKMLEDSPDIVEAFHKASIKGWLYAFENIEESAELIYNKYNSQNKTLESLIYEGKEMKKLSVVSGVAFGSISLEKLKSIEQSYRIMNLLDESIDYFGLIYNPSYKLFSKEEKAYLWKKGAIRICVLRDNLPYESYTDGLYQGLVAEYVNKIARSTKLPIEWNVSENINESMKKLQYDQCDLVPMTIKNSMHDTTLEYTSGFLSQKIAVVSDKELPFVRSVDELSRYHISISQKSGLKEHLNGIMPKKEFLEVSSIDQAIDLIKKGVIKTHISTLFEANVALAKDSEIKINTILDDEIINSAAVRFNEKHLQSIVSKIFDNVDEKERQRIENRWLKVEIVKIYESQYILIIIAIGIVAITLLYLGYLYFQRAVKRAVGSRVLDEMVFFENNKLSAIGSMIDIIATHWREKILLLREMQNQLREEKNGDDALFVESSLREQQAILQDMSSEIGKFLTLYRSDKSRQNLNLYDVFQDAKEIWKHSLEDSKITLLENIDKSIEIYASKNELLQLFLSIINHITDRFKLKKIEDGIVHLIIKREDERVKIIFQDSDSGFDEIGSLFDRKNQSTMVLSLYTTKQMIKEVFEGSFKIEKNQIGLLFEIELGGKSV